VFPALLIPVIKRMQSAENLVSIDPAFEQHLVFQLPLIPDTTITESELYIP